MAFPRSFLHKLIQPWHLGTIFRIPIRLDSSIVCLPVIAFLHADRTGIHPIIVLGLFGIAFGIVILHELGHCLVARYFGYPIEGISIFPLGGVASIDCRQPKARPASNLWIALGGPAVNAFIFTVGMLLFGIPDWVAIEVLFSKQVSSWAAWVGMGMVINGLMLAFNLLPIYPMDGGRVITHAMEILCGETKGRLVGMVVTAITLALSIPLFLSHQFYMAIIVVLFAVILGAVELFLGRKKMAQAEKSFLAHPMK